MKKITLLFSLLFIAAVSFSQVTLTYSDNALTYGDSVASKEIQYVSPGLAGPNQMWDFSKISFTGTNLSSHVNNSTASPSKYMGDYNLVFDESGYVYYNNLSRTDLEENGYTTKNLSLTYSKPLIKMKYPFSFGDSFTQNFAGVAFFMNTTPTDFSGNYTVTADAYGTLILPDKNIKNTLRVKSVKKAVEVGPCNATDVTITRFFWYAPGYRYPVFVLINKKYQTTGQDSVVTKTGYVSMQTGLWNNTTAGITDPNTDDNSDFTVLSYPNPFSDNLSYSYFLRKNMPVKIELFDVAGKYNVNLTDDLSQTEGIHTGTLDATTLGLTPGVYYLRFTFDKKVVVSKVVKI